LHQLLEQAYGRKFAVSKPREFAGAMVPTASQAMDPAMIAVRDVETRAQRPSVVDKAMQPCARGPTRV